LDFTLAAATSALASGHIAFYIFTHAEHIYYVEFLTGNGSMFDQMRPTFERIIESFRPVQ